MSPQEPTIPPLPSRLPLWLIGLANAPLGFVYGFINTAMPLLLVAEGVSLARVATISAIAFSPTFWLFLLAPLLELRLSRRGHALLWTGVAAAGVYACVLLLHHIVLFTVVLTTACAAAGLFGSSLGGWLPEIVSDEQRGHVSAWYNVANLGVAALFGTAAILLVRHLPAHLAGLLLGLGILAPTAILFGLPAPLPPARSARVVFGSLLRDLAKLLRQREMLLALIAFLTPASCFALTNLFAGLGPDFATPERGVTLLCGFGVALACSMGCLLGGPLADRFSRMHLYILTGLGGALVAIGAALAPHRMPVFVAVTLLYNFSQGINYTAYTALCFRLVGSANPLAATQFSLLFCAINLPISYMTWVDGRGYARFGLRGLFLVDAAGSLLFGVALLLLMTLLLRRGRTGATTPGMIASQ